MRLTSTHLAIALTLSLLAPAAAMAQEPILPDEVKDIPTEYAGALPVQGVPSVKLVEGDLIIQGTRDKDRVLVKLHEGSEVAVVHNGATIHEAPLASVERVWFDGGKSADVFKNDTHLPCVAFGGEGNDQLTGGTADDQLIGSDRLGNDSINAINLLYGRDGDDVLVGYHNGDVLYGGEGADVLYGVEGDDVILGDAGDDVLQGGEGEDVVLGGEGRDFIKL